MQAPPVARKTNQMALVSLIAAVAGYVIPHPFVASFIAIYCGHKAKTELRANGNAEDGDSYATIGLVVGYVHLALSILGCVLAILWLGAIMAALGIAGAAAQHGAH